MDFLKNDKKIDLIGFGEVMLRLSASDKDKISQGNIFEKNVGGAELNVISGAALLGIQSAIITKLPDSKLGRFARNMIRYCNVSDDYIIYDKSPERRLGLYFYETGAYPRKSSVVYDRAHSSMTTLKMDEINPEVFDLTRMFHISGISLALGLGLRQTAIELIRKFKEQGVAISFDVNYRATLWDEDTARETIKSILPFVDVLSISEESSRRMFRKTGTIEEIMKSYTEEYGCKVVITTRREAISPNKHNFGSIIYSDSKFYQEDSYRNIEVVDRIGSGDAYLAGALFGILKYGDLNKALEFGNAMAAVKNTIYGDMPVSSLDEIEGIIRAHQSTGIQDEMNR